MEKINQNYYNQATTKEADVFRQYLGFLRRRGINCEGKTICDIGCATGNFISVIAETNICYGVDFSKYAIAKCKKRFYMMQNRFAYLDLNTADKLPFKTKFDLITLFDVVEHINNLGNIKTILLESLKFGGHLVITTPNANNILRFINTRWFSGEMDNTHVNLFTPYTLDYFLRKTGLRKISISTPYNFYFKDNWLSSAVPFGGQIFAIYKLEAGQKSFLKKNDQNKKNIDQYR
jgi:2-polyprenyl-3-methyl-5-hydroxy-6-metoxy-1,4-benzoquinol methylase